MGFFKESMIPKAGVTTKSETVFLCKDFEPCHSGDYRPES